MIDINFWPIRLCNFARWQFIRLYADGIYLLSYWRFSVCVYSDRLYIFWQKDLTIFHFIVIHEINNICTQLGLHFMSLFVTRCRRRGTIDMTLVLPCVRPSVRSVRPSVRPSEWSCLRDSPYIFHQIHLKFCRLSSYDMKMCTWFWNIYSTIFDGVIAYSDLNFANHNLVSTTPSTSFIWCIWNYVDFFPMIWRCACGLGFLIELFLTELLPMLTYTLLSERSCLRNSFYIVHRIHLKFCGIIFLWYEDVHVIMDFWFGFFDRVIAYADLYFAKHNLSPQFLLHFSSDSFEIM